jgi:hypothetical protein
MEIEEYKQLDTVWIITVDKVSAVVLDAGRKNAIGLRLLTEAQEQALIGHYPEVTFKFKKPDRGQINAAIGGFDRQGGGSIKRILKRTFGWN